MSNCLGRDRFEVGQVPRLTSPCSDGISAAIRIIEEYLRKQCDGRHIFEVSFYNVAGLAVN